MPADALPEPRPMPVALPGAVPVRREYRDVLGRPMAGAVTVTPQSPADAAGVAVVAAPVKVELAGGVLAVSLPPGYYRLSADLRTADGATATSTGTLTVPTA